MTSSFLCVIVGPLLAFSRLAQHTLMLICGSSIATVLAAVLMTLVEFFGALFRFCLLAMPALLVRSLLFVSDAVSGCWAVTAGCLAAQGAWSALVHKVRRGRGQHLRLLRCAMEAIAMSRCSGGHCSLPCERHNCGCVYALMRSVVRAKCAICLSVCLSIYVSVYLSIYLRICLSDRPRCAPYICPIGQMQIKNMDIPPLVPAKEL
jgi:hypothetical protein